MKNKKKILKLIKRREKLLKIVKKKKKESDEALKEHFNNLRYGHYSMFVTDTGAMEEIKIDDIEHKIVKEFIKGLKEWLK